LTASSANAVVSACFAILFIHFVVQTQDPVAEITAFIGGKRVLLVFDNCEHVIAAVTTIVSRIFKANPDAYLLTTTHEVLRVDGETVTLLSPLEIPTESDFQLTAVECLEWASEPPLAITTAN